MLETAGIALATLFATIGPLDVAALFAALTSTASPDRRLSMAIRGLVIAGIILITFALVGERLLGTLGISLAALRIAGGILLLLIGIDMAFARTTGGTSTTLVEVEEAASKQDISVFPLATPIIAGPGAMGAIILLMANTNGDFRLQLVVIVSLIVILLVTFVAILLATKIQALLGLTGMHVVSRVFGVLLCALAVQFMIDGIQQSGLVAT